MMLPGMVTGSREAMVVSWSSQLVHGERKVVGQKGSEE